MKEILKSKVMVGFMLFIIGVCAFNAISINNELKIKEISDQGTIVINDK